ILLLKRRDTASSTGRPARSLSHGRQPFLPGVRKWFLNFVRLLSCCSLRDSFYIAPTERADLCSPKDAVSHKGVGYAAKSDPGCSRRTDSQCCRDDGYG